jgi:hypothetical protein
MPPARRSEPAANREAPRSERPANREARRSERAINRRPHTPSAGSARAILSSGEEAKRA